MTNVRHVQGCIALVLSFSSIVYHSIDSDTRISAGRDACTRLNLDLETPSYIFHCPYIEKDPANKSSTIKFPHPPYPPPQNHIQLRTNMPSISQLLVFVTAATASIQWNGNKGTFCGICSHVGYNTINKGSAQPGTCEAYCAQWQLDQNIEVCCGTIWAK